MPDLNSVPASPHALAVRRQSSSQTMPPPPVPQSPSLNILPSNQNAVNQVTATSSPSLMSPQLPPPVAPPPAPDNTGVGPGPGPLRHPRPLTAAELHMQLEKEQEAVVNRLTRELTMLRAAQNASVVSNTSSTSASGTEGTPAADSHHFTSGSGFSIPSSTGRRHHRTSSSTSNRSQALLGISLGASSMVGAASGPLPAPAGRLSRQNSTASRRSRASSPIPPLQHHHQQYHSGHSGDPALERAGYFYRAAQPLPTSTNNATTSGSTVAPAELSPGLMPATSRYEEVAFYRAELESAKRENDALRRRIRELERAVRDRRASDASASVSVGMVTGTGTAPAQGRDGGGAPTAGSSVRGARSESVSTTASVAASTTAGVSGSSGVAVAGSRSGGGGGGAGAGGRERVVSSMSTTGSVAVGVPDEEVRVGESAASSGLRGGAAA